MKKKARLTAAATTLHFTYAELAIATRLRISSQMRNPATMPAPSVQLARNHEPPANPTCNPNRIRPGIHVTIDSMPTRTVSRASAYVQRVSGRLKYKGSALLARSGAIRPGPASAARKTAKPACTYMKIEKNRPST